jgi:PAS domain S-box-containing protein
MAAKAGVHPAELIGRKCHEIVQGRDAPAENCPHTSVLETGQDYTCEMAAPSLGGVFDVSVSPLYDARGVLQGTVHVARDITTRKQVEEALVQSERRYRQLFEISPYPMLVQREGKILLANAAAATAYGVASRDDLIGRLFSDLVHEDFQSRLADLLCEGEETAEPPRFVEIGIVRPDGNTAYVEITAVPTRYEGEPAVLCVGQDLTARKRAEESLLKAERLKAVGELASGVAHNFNNLLQVIMTGAQLATLQLEKLGETKEKLDQILETSRLGAETVQRLQEFAQVRQEKASTGKEEVVDLTHVTHRAVEISEPWWKTSPEKEGLKIGLTSKLVPGCFVKGREGELFEVVLNLVKNAAEALPNGGEIAIFTRIDGDRVILEIHDNGIGIAEESFGKIFEPFWTSKGFQATGMGLASSLGIIKRNGGDIRVESRKNEGSTFTVTLPLAHEMETRKEVIESPEIKRRLNILAIDDTEPVVSLLKDALGEYGQTVTTALSGVEGIEIFKNNPVDLVICDLAMPGMSGWRVAEAMQEICRERGIAKIPFLLLTGWGVQLEEQSKLAAVGVDGIIEKPIDIERLMITIHEKYHEA